MADFHDTARTAYDDLSRNSFVIAYNIEDLQIYYYFDTEDVDMTKIATAPLISSDRLDEERVKAVAVGITAGSPYGDGPRDKFRPALFNRLAGTRRDDRIRSTLVQTVPLRNFHEKPKT